MSEYKRNNRISEALAIRGMRQVELCELTGIKKASVNGWVKQNWQPKQEALYKMAKVLDVSEMWLAGYDVPMERPIAQVKLDEISLLVEEMKRNDRVKDLYIKIAKLSPDQFTLIEGMVNQLVN